MRHTIRPLLLVATAALCSVAVISTSTAQSPKTVEAKAYQHKSQVGMSDVNALKDDVQKLQGEQRKIAGRALDGAATAVGNDGYRADHYYNIVVDILNGDLLDPAADQARRDAAAAKPFDRKSGVTLGEVMALKREAQKRPGDSGAIAVRALDGAASAVGSDGYRADHYYNVAVDILNGDLLNPQTDQARRAATAAKTYQHKSQVGMSDVNALKDDVQQLQGEQREIAGRALNGAAMAVGNDGYRADHYYNVTVDILNGDLLSDAQ